MEHLISEVYDKANPVNPQSARMTVHYTLKFNKAKVVADAVKDVYRELLSSKDKALQNNGNNDKKPMSTGNTYIFGGDSDSSEGKRTQVTFNGRLSVGVDEHSNTLLVSTDGQNLMENVMRLITALDESAKPSVTSMRVVQLGPGMTSNDFAQGIRQQAPGTARRRMGFSRTSK